ncbi:MAG: metallophosphoesterase [Deltaproteobacteria bacterium]|nr:metallophosphoesterase [Deltaproteobacteria bacterium]
MEAIKLVVSDLHLGSGRFTSEGIKNPYEDFFFDESFVELLEYYTSGKYDGYDVELIINGDFLNLLQADILKDGITITEPDSLVMLQRIMKGHSAFFDALRQFMYALNHHVSIIVGNHDQGLLWNKVEKLLKNAVSPRMDIYNRSKSFDGVYIEHGNDYDILNSFSARDYAQKSAKTNETILNIPWGSYFVMTFIYPRKRVTPYLDRIRPLRKYIRWGLFFDTAKTFGTLIMMVWFYLKNRFHPDPRVRKKFHITLDRIMESLKLSSLAETAVSILKHTHYRVVIFGHTHIAMQIDLHGKQYINTGTWTEIVSMGIDNPGRHTKLTYALIDYSTSPVRASLREWNGHYRIEHELPR